MKTHRIYARARALLALLVVLAFGCQDAPAPGPKLGSFVPGGGGSTTITTVTFASPLVISAGHRRMVWAGATPAVLVKALSGHTPGGRLTVELPHDTATALYLAPELNCRGDFSVDPATYAVLSWDATKAHIVEVEQSTTFTTCAMVTLAAPDTTAPTVTAASVAQANPNAITATFSEPMLIAAADVGTAITAPCSVGTTRTLTAIEAGNGTTQVTFTASGDYAGTETCKLVVGSGRVSTDYSGNKVATNGAGQSIDMLFSSGLAGTAAWTMAFDKATGLAPPSSGTFTSWTDLISGTAQLVPQFGSAPTVTAGIPIFTADITQRIHVAAVPTTGTDFSLFAETNDPALADGGHSVSFDRDGAAIDTWITLSTYFQIEITGNAYAGSGTGAQDTTVSPGGAAYHRLYLSRTGDQLTLQVDARSPVTVTNAQSVTGLTHLSVGGLLYNNALILTAFSGGIKRLGYIANRAWTGTEIADTDAFAVANP